MLEGHTTHVLDHGYVKFISSMGTDETVIEAARMSTGKGFISWDWYEECHGCGAVSMTAGGSISGGNPVCLHTWKKKRDSDLLEFMWKNKHATPFEMCELHIEVQAPILAIREWFRSRTQSYNEFSARYSVMPNLHYVPDASRFEMKQSTNKQESSISLLGTPTAPEDLRSLVEEEQNRVYDQYESLLENGVPKEIARLNTPVSRYSKFRAKTDLRNWLGFLNLRMRPNAQYEIRVFANAVADIIEGIWPRSYALFEEYDLYGCSMSRSDLNDLRTRSMGDLNGMSKGLQTKLAKGGLEIL